MAFSDAWNSPGSTLAPDSSALFTSVCASPSCFSRDSIKRQGVVPLRSNGAPM
jgi:hypothetical protein